VNQTNEKKDTIYENMQQENDDESGWEKERNDVNTSADTKLK
jgi:hypothetical protein